MLAVLAYAHERWIVPGRPVCVRLLSAAWDGGAVSALCTKQRRQTESQCHIRGLQTAQAEALDAQLRWFTPPGGKD